MMPGVGAPQPPSSGPPPNYNRRRRHSLPALSSDQLNRLSENASRKQGEKASLSKSLPERTFRKAEKPTEKGRSKNNSSNNSKSIDKPVVSKNPEIVRDNNNNSSVRGNENPRSHNDNYSGSSTLQSKVQLSKSNAVFVFRFEDDDEKDTESPPPDSKSKSSLSFDDLCAPISDTSPSLSQTRQSGHWSNEFIQDLNSYNLSFNPAQSNNMGFCGFKHKRFRESGKLYITMSPVMELKTPTDETEYESEDEWSMVSTSDYWTDARSSNDTNSPRLSRAKDISGRLRMHNYNKRLPKADTDADLSHNLRSALSLSPRRSSSRKNPLAALKEMSKRSHERPSPPRSPHRLGQKMRRNSADSAVGQIFNNLQTPSSSATSRTAKSNTKPATLSPSSVVDTSGSNRLSPGDNSLQQSKPVSPLVPRLLTRRRSIGALPELANAKGADQGTQRRGTLTAHHHLIN